ncbi:myosin light chain 3, skeletal muscle isoform-like [Clavelina lepadiformis]|uniref:EF-hand domain-containing protein n=1 Tax=Clavelina lepadiformis TaxID=159417 RepID=A0ABP0EXZ4_CLALP
MANITEEQMEDIKEAFEIFTKTPDMEVGYDQVGDILRALKMNPAEEDIVKILGNPSKEDMAVKLLKLEEFIPVFDKALTDVVSGTYDDLLEGVRIFDKEGNGTVMGAELRHVLRTLGEKMTMNEIGAVMDGKEDMNGLINIECFCRYLVEDKSEEK